MKRIAIAITMLATSAMGAELEISSPHLYQGPFSITTPCCTNLMIGGPSAVVIVTKDGIVTNGAGVPLDELPVADQIATMCEAFGLLAKTYAGVIIKRCGKP